MTIEQQKKIAAEKAVEEIQSGMIVGLGTGSTVQFALEKIAEKLEQGLLKNVLAIPSSVKTEKEATRLGISLVTFDEALKRRAERSSNKKSEISSQKHEVNVKTNSPFSIPRFQRGELNSSPRFDLFHQVEAGQFAIDLTIDGADEFDSELNLIKGGGGALLREKILAQASKRLIIITDESKRSKYLGEKWPVPIEIIQMALPLEIDFLENLGAITIVRKNSEGNCYITDEGNFIVDANFGTIHEPDKLAQKLNDRAGIVEHGLFLGMADKIICASNNGAVQEYYSKK